MSLSSIISVSVLVLVLVREEYEGGGGDVSSAHRFLIPQSKEILLDLTSLLDEDFTPAFAARVITSHIMYFGTFAGTVSLGIVFFDG